MLRAPTGILFPGLRSGGCSTRQRWQPTPKSTTARVSQLGRTSQQAHEQYRQNALTARSCCSSFACSHCCDTETSGRPCNSLHNKKETIDRRSLFEQNTEEGPSARNCCCPGAAAAAGPTLFICALQRHTWCLSKSVGNARNTTSTQDADGIGTHTSFPSDYAEDSEQFQETFTLDNAQLLALQKLSQSGLDKKPEIVTDSDEVFVILFGVGQQETEGIYSLRGRLPDGLPLETVVAFSTKVDADRYAGLLEASMDHVPHVCTLPVMELRAFCTEAGYNLRIEPEGSHLIPPDYNVGVTDWERVLRLKGGHWTVLAEEPAIYALAERALDADMSSELGDKLAGMSESALEECKLRLETLLPE